MPTVTELDATDFVQLKYDFTHMTASGKPKKEQVSLFTEHFTAHLLQIQGWLL